MLAVGLHPDSPVHAHFAVRCDHDALLAIAAGDLDGISFEFDGDHCRLLALEVVMHVRRDHDLVFLDEEAW
jgi:phage head maturation protease